MKNKKLIYVLLPAAIFIWGLIIYRIMSASSGEEMIISTTQNYQVGDLEMTVDTFSIVANYRDPFLGRIITEPKLAPKKIVTKPKVVIPVRWPLITYGGMIKNNKSEKVVAIVNINRKSNLMNLGDVVSEVELLEIHSDSIKVKFSGIKKYITK